MDGTYCKNCQRKKLFLKLLGQHFCIFCLKNTPNHIYTTVTDTITVKDSIEIKIFLKFSKGAKDWISHTILGWFPSERADLSPGGVIKQQIADRKEDFYKKKVTDYKTGRIIRDVEKKLSDHK